MHPNQNVKDVLKFAAEMSTTADNILADKKVSLAEAFQLIPSLMAVPALIPKFPKAWDELKNADDESKADIIAYAQQNFELSNDQTEGLIEDLVGVFTHGTSLVARFAK